jgi:hypothetical protein
MTKTWQLRQDNFGPDDAAWIIGLGCRVSVKTDTIDVNVTGSQTIKVAGRTHINITTETDKQDNMLHLKYGDTLYLAWRDWN